MFAKNEWGHHVLLSFAKDPLPPKKKIKKKYNKLNWPVRLPDNMMGDGETQ